MYEIENILGIMCSNCDDKNRCRDTQCRRAETVKAKKILILLKKEPTPRPNKVKIEGGY